MNVRSIIGFALVLCLALPGMANSTKTSTNLSAGVPSSAHLAIYVKKNPERDFQKQYWQQIWQTFEEEKIADRFLAAITGQIPEDNLNQARSVLDEIKVALKPIHCHALLHAEELAYAQSMESIFNQHVVLIRLNRSDAAGFELGVAQLFDLFSKWSEGKVAPLHEKLEGASLVTLKLPAKVPFRPAVIRHDDVVILSTHEKLARECLDTLTDASLSSKFDDPRIVEGLAELPAAEDAIIFFDARLMLKRFGNLPAFIRQQDRGNNPELERGTKLMDAILKELTFFDYELTVEYTEGHQCRQAAIGRLLPDTDQKIVVQALSQGKPFENWQTWVPADADGFSLNTGFNLHVLYKGVMKFVRDNIPEFHDGLDKFETAQEELGFNLDRDLLQAFSGETVSVTLPIKKGDGSTRQSTVAAMRCTDPEGVKALLNRALEALMQLPPVQAQQLKWVECADLAGFQELKAPMLKMFGIRPVVGFSDGWMMIGGNPEAVARVIATRKGEIPSIDHTSSFQKFGLDVTGPVYQMSYTDLGTTIRSMADAIEGAGAIAPMLLGSMAMHADPEKLKPVQELISLLPSIAKVVREFDFIDERLTVVREGPKDNTYRRDVVYLLRDPATAEAD